MENYNPAILDFVVLIPIRLALLKQRGDPIGLQGSHAVQAIPGDTLKIIAVLVFILSMLANRSTVAQQASFVPATSPSVPSSLRSGFANPPDAGKLRCYWWWLNGYTTEDTITHDLTEMKSKGFVGAILVDAYSEHSEPVPVGPAYGSPAFMKLYLHALKVAESLGMQISLTITSGGNVGILGGPGVDADDALKLLTYSRTEFTGGTEQEVQTSAPEAFGSYYRQIAVLAYPLKHGAPLPGESGSARNAIPALNARSDHDQTGDSMPDPAIAFRDAPSVTGEQDTELNQIVDLSKQVDGSGKLHWNFPSGQWEVLRIGYTVSSWTTTNQEGTGYAVDAMSAEAFNHYWGRVVEPILSASKPYLGKSLRYLVTDSWEANSANWTKDFRAEFIRRRGYDPVPYLPVIAGRIVDSREVSDNFLDDLRRTVADLINENYFDLFAKHAAAYGLGIHPESGGPHGAPVDSLETFRRSAFPQTEFWTASPEHRTADWQRFFVKEGSSAAHIYGKHFVAAESFSRMGPPWAVSPGLNIKPTFDHALTEGLNLVFWHEFTSSPVSFGKPGIEYFADTHINPNATWWNQAGQILSSMNRSLFLMQQGQPVEDLLYYYGDSVPNFARLKEDDPAHVLPGFDYDVTDEDALLHRMIYSGGDLHTPEGIHYRALAIPSEPWLALPDLVWMEKYVRAGGTLIGRKPAKPVGIVSQSNLAEFTRIASAMWGSCDAASRAGSVPYGRGTIYCTSNSHQALAAMHIVPDLAWSGGDDTSFDFAHRRSGYTDIYFVRNVNDATVKATLHFRVKGRTPELWDSEDGKARPVPAFRELGEQTSIPLTFPPHGSAFVLFEHLSGLHAVSIQEDGQEVFPSISAGMETYGTTESAFYTTNPGSYEIELSNGQDRKVTMAPPQAQPELTGAWTVTFPDGRGAPTSLAMDTLESWTKSPVAGVRYFSGTATYHRTIEVPAQLMHGQHEIWMNLGDAREVASVAINGKPVRTLWHPPFMVRIDPDLHEGTNTVAIQVTNLWPNRIIGDLQPLEKVKYTQTNIRVYTKDSPLLPSGLLTPVELYATEGAKIE